MAPLALSMAVEAAEVGMLPVMFPGMMRGLGLTVADLGLLTAANKLAGVAAAPVWVWVAGRWSRKRVLVAAAALSGLVTIAMGQAAQGFASLLLLYCLLAAVCTGVAPLTTAALADLFDDRSRGRAVGAIYAAIAVVVGLTGTFLGQFLEVQDGWRLAYLTLGAGGLLAAVLTAGWFQDPGVGATERRTDVAPHPVVRRPGLRAAVCVFCVPSFLLMLLSRLLSGHLVIGSFGILFLTQVRHFPNAEAALVLLPYGVGVCVGNLAGSVAVDRLHTRAPHRGRVLFLQVAQLAFAGVAYVATQIPWEGIGAYLVLWAMLGALQGVNPGVNRPIVIAVIRPELRNFAFLAMLAIVEPLGWAAYNVGVSRFGDGDGLQSAFLVVLVGIMLLNGLALTPLYWTYRRDSERAWPSLVAHGLADG